MAGRVPPGADRAAVQAEMETVFLENLRHAAGVLAQVRGRNTQLMCERVRGTRWGLGTVGEIESRARAQARGTDEVVTSDP